MVCVKDVNQTEFVYAFANFLKNPARSPYQNGPTWLKQQPRNKWAQHLMTGSTCVPLLSQDNCTSTVPSVLAACLLCTVLLLTAVPDLLTLVRVTDISLALLCNNLKK